MCLQAAVFILFSVSIAHAERLPVTTYTVANGLLRDYVFKIRQDSRGFMWLCTTGGLSRFDGYAFTNFTVADGLPAQGVNDLAETSDGEILIATNNGLARLNPRGLAGSVDAPLFTAYLPPDPGAKNVQNILLTNTGEIYTGTSNGLYRVMRAGGAISFEAVNLNGAGGDIGEVTSLTTDKGGALWAGTQKAGLFRISADGGVDHFTTANGLPADHIESLLVDSNGRIWVGMRAGTVAGLCLLIAEPRAGTNVVQRLFTEKDGLPNEWIMALEQTIDGEMWVATIRGLCKWQAGYGEPETGGVCKTYTKKNDICDTDVWALTEDKDGNLWTGTRCGLKKIARYGFTTYTADDGVDATFINSMFQNSTGELFATFDPGSTRTVSRFNGESFETVKPNFPPDVRYFGWGTMQTVWQDKSGKWYFPTGAGIYSFAKPGRFADLATATPQRLAPDDAGAEIFRLFEDSHRVQWIATTGAKNGLWRFEPDTNTWRDLSGELGFTGDRLAWAITEDRSGNIWISTGSVQGGPSLIRYKDGAFRTFSTADGWPAGLGVNMFVDHAGYLWIAHSAGLLRLKDVNSDQLGLTRYTTREGLATAGAECVTEDAFGRIYVCTARGLDRLDPATGQIENFTTADGLPNSFPQMGLRDRNDDLWFGTTDGIARYRPEPIRRRNAPNALITGVRVAGVARPVSVLGEVAIPPLELDPGQRQIAVDFLGLGSNPGERLSYDYRFGGSDWTPTTERTVNFADLGAGNYEFEVRARTADNIYSAPATVGFRIASPLWQRWWFILACLAAAVLIVYVYYRNRLHRLLELERIRTRIAADLHDDIGANLTRIALLSEVANQLRGNGNGNGDDELLPSIANIARESVASMNDIVWAISPDHDSLLDLTRRMRQYAEDVSASMDIDLEFAAPPPGHEFKLTVGARRDLLLIFKEAVNNAARHSGCTRISIALDFDGSTLSLQVSDNGRGFDTSGESEGHGLRSISRRAAALSGDIKIASAAGEGTTIRLELQLSRAARV